MIYFCKGSQGISACLGWFPCGCSAADARKTKNIWCSSERCYSSSFPASSGRNHQALLVMVLLEGTACCAMGWCPPRFTPGLAQQAVSSACGDLAPSSGVLPVLRSCGGEWPAGIQRREAKVCKCLYSAICTPFWKNKNTLSWFGATLSGTSVDSVSWTLWWSQPHANLWRTMQSCGKCMFSSLELQYDSFRQFYHSVLGFWAKHYDSFGVLAG